MASVLIIGRSQQHVCLISALDAGLHHTRCHASVTTAVRSLTREVPDLVILAETVHPLAQAFVVRHLREAMPDVKVVAMCSPICEDVCSEALDGFFLLGDDSASLLAAVDAILLTARADPEPEQGPIL
jgi:hypothetical protein